MNSVSCSFFVGVEERDFPRRIPRMRFSFLLRVIPLFAALHAAALFAQDAQAQASGVALHAGWDAAASQRAEQLAEGEAAFLTVRATGLSDEARLEVLITADPSADVKFTSTATLTAAAPSTRVRVTATQDGRAEPREKVVFRASAPDDTAVASTTARLIIPRHGYALDSLAAIPSNPRLGETAQVEARFNAPAPASATIIFRFRPPGAAAVTLRQPVRPGERAVRLALPDIARTGLHRAFVQGFSFAEAASASGDQRDWMLNERSLEFRALAALGLQLSISRETVFEGDDEETFLHLEARNLRAEESLAAVLVTNGERRLDVSLAEPLTPLTAETPRKSVLISALSDGLPEPREEVTVAAQAALGSQTLAGSASFVIPRHGYAVEKVSVSPLRLHQGGAGEPGSSAERAGAGAGGGVL